MEQLGLYKFNVLKDKKGRGWFYQLHINNYKLQSLEFFEHKNRAHFAAVGHITLNMEELEKYNLKINNQTALARS